MTDAKSDRLLGQHMLDEVGGGVGHASRATAWTEPRRLQLNATSFSWRQASHFTRRNPCSRRPHFRYASNSSMTKWGE